MGILVDHSPPGQSSTEGSCDWAEPKHFRCCSPGTTGPKRRNGRIKILPGYINPSHAAQFSGNRPALLFERKRARWLARSDQVKLSGGHYLFYIPWGAFVHCRRAIRKMTWSSQNASHQAGKNRKRHAKDGWTLFINFHRFSNAPSGLKVLARWYIKLQHQVDGREAVCIAGFEYHKKQQSTILSASAYCSE